MKKRIISALLVLVMLCSLLPFGVIADSANPYEQFNGYTAKFSPSDNADAITTQMYVISQSTQDIAPGITGTDVCFNDASGNNQVVGYMTTLDLSGGNVKIKATYKGFYNGTDSSKWSVEKWGMQTLTEQAAAYEAATGENVVAATNGDYFNMQTGQPLGVLVMNGVNCNPDKTAAEPYFAILKDGTAVIRDMGTPIDDVAEAISSPSYLVKNGVNMISPYETSLIPGNSIGIDDQGRVLTYVADGRQKPYSRGISRYELAEFWIAQGVKNVLYLDGGGSATSLAAEGNAKGALELRNSPCDGYERGVSSGLLFISTSAPATGTFGSATVYTSADSYPKGAEVKFAANCIDTAGYKIDAEYTWMLDTASSDLGTIDAKTGIFTSNGTAGDVTASLVYGEKVVASKTVSITSSTDYSGYTGFISENGNKSFLINGKITKGWFAIGAEWYHAGDDGVLHQTTTTDTRTCLENGYIKGKCNTCGAATQGQQLWSIGHKWDENHICIRCGTKGIDINTLSVPNPKSYSYTGKPIAPAINYLTYEGITLNIRSSRNGTDGYVSFYNNVDVGVADITIEGRGDFYGTLEHSFYIVPGSIPALSANNITDDSATLVWPAAPGASTYIVEQNINGTWKSIATVSTNSYTVTKLSPDTSYEYRVAWRAAVGGKNFSTATGSRPVVNFTTYNVNCNFSCTLANGQAITPTMVENEFYVFLPSGTDLTKLALTSNDNSPLSVTGDKGTADSTSAIDITKIASLKDGMYSVDVKTGAGKVAVKIMVSDSIGSIFLTSTDAENEGRSYVDAVKGNSTTGKMLFIGADGSTVLYDGALTQIKSRGNSSFTYSPKKAYQIKLESKTDLLGNGEKGKTWVLLANYMDATAIHDKLFKDLASQMGMEGSPDCNWVDLYYDGEYRGTYLLSEKASIGKTTVNISDMEDAYSEVNDAYGEAPSINEAKNAYSGLYKYTENLTEPENITGGYLLEINGSRGIDEASGFKTSQGFDVNVKSPEFAGKDAMKYISEYFQEFEDAVYAQDEHGNYTGYNEKTGKYFYEYCDMNSLVQMYLIQHIAASPDAFHASLYFYKDADGIMYAGPIWDMDLSLGSGMTSDILPNNSYINIYRYLSQALIQIPEFKQALMSYFASDFKPMIQKLIDSGIDEYAGIVDASVAMDHVLWPFVRSGKPDSTTHLYGDEVSYESLIANTKEWLASRLKYTENVVNHEHKYKHSEVAPTCTKDGTSTDKCSVCGAVKEWTIPALGHDYKAVVTAPTCTEKGYTTHTCACGDSYIDSEVPALGHSFGEWAVTTAPTCTEKGVETRSCACGEAETREIAALGHSFGEWAATTAPTCTEKGVETRSCACGEAETREIAALGHDYQKGKCTRCGDINNPFVDIDNLKPEFKDAILWAYYNEPEQITKGITETEFVPDKDCTRAQVVTFLWRAADCPEPTTENNPFPDVNPIQDNGKDNPYYKAILWAVEKGITNGFGDGLFKPNDTVTRAQFVTFLWRYEGQQATTGSIAGFADADEIAAPYQQAVAWAVENGITMGYEDETFRPNGSCARWAVVLFMFRDMA